MIKPSPRFFRQSATILRRSWGRDAAGGPVGTPDAGQTVVCQVQEQQDLDAQIIERDGDSIVARRRYEVLIPAKHPTTGADQFPTADYPAGPAIRISDRIVWSGRTLSVTADVDKAGRGGYGHIFTAQCFEVV